MIRTLLGKSAYDIHADLVQVYCIKGALSYPGVRRWAHRFRVGMEDDPWARAPVTAVVPENIPVLLRNSLIQILISLLLRSFQKY